MTGGGRSKVVEPQLRVLSLRILRAAATASRPALAVAAALARASVAAATSAEVASLPGGWCMGKPIWGESSWLQGVCVPLPLPRRDRFSARSFLRTEVFQWFLT